MRRLVLVFLGLVSSSGYSESVEVINFNQAFPTFALNCGMEKKDGKYFSVHVEDKDTCSDLSGIWTEAAMHASN